MRTKLFSLFVALVLSLGMMAGEMSALPNFASNCNSCHDRPGVTTTVSTNTLEVTGGATSDNFTVTVEGSGYKNKGTASDIYLPQGWSASLDYASSFGRWYWTDVVDDPSHQVTFNANITVPSGTPVGDYQVIVWGAGYNDQEKKSSGSDTIIVTVTAADVGEEEQTSNRAIYFELHQNYPNPFNPETEISYTLLKDSRVKLDIYNLLGQRIRTLVDEYQEAGDRSVSWDGKDERGREVTSGIYLYRLQAGEYSEVRKMVLVK